MTSHQRSILAVAMLTQGVSIGLSFGIFPILLEPLEEAFDAPRTVASAGQILIMVALVAGGMVAGPAFDRGYARRVMLAGALLLSGAFALASVASNLWVLGLAALALGFSVPSLGPLAGGSLITRVFDEERGRALGLMSMGPPLGSGLLAGLVGSLLLIFELREVFLILAVLSLALTVPTIWIFIPARIEPAEGTGGSDGGMGELLRMPTFWWSAGIFAIASGIIMGWTTQMAAFLGGNGLDTAQQSGLMAVVFWMGVPGALVFGLLADRFGLTALFAVMLGGMTSIFAIFVIGVPAGLIAVLCACFGFLFGALIPLFMMLLGQKMGPLVLGRAMALSNLLALPVMAASVFFSAAVYEEHGNYDRALVVLAIGMLAAVGCLYGSSRSSTAPPQSTG
jgi:predicted MFS family arabinose efflux permease